MEIVQETPKGDSLGRGRLRGSHSEGKERVEKEETANDKNGGRRRPCPADRAGRREVTPKSGIPEMEEPKAWRLEEALGPALGLSGKK